MVHNPNNPTNIIHTLSDPKSTHTSEQLNIIRKILGKKVVIRQKKLTILYNGIKKLVIIVYYILSNKISLTIISGLIDKMYISEGAYSLILLSMYYFLINFLALLDSIRPGGGFPFCISISIKHIFLLIGILWLFNTGLNRRKLALSQIILNPNNNHLKIHEFEDIIKGLYLFIISLLPEDGFIRENIEYFTSVTLYGQFKDLMSDMYYSILEIFGVPLITSQFVQRNNYTFPLNQVPLNQYPFNQQLNLNSNQNGVCNIININISIKWTEVYGVGFIINNFIPFIKECYRLLTEQFESIKYIGDTIGELKDWILKIIEILSVDPMAAAETVVNDINEHLVKPLSEGVDYFWKGGMGLLEMGVKWTETQQQQEQEHLGITVNDNLEVFENNGNNQTMGGGAYKRKPKKTDFYQVHQLFSKGYRHIFKAYLTYLEYSDKKIFNKLSNNKNITNLFNIFFTKAFNLYDFHNKFLQTKNNIPIQDLLNLIHILNIKQFKEILKLPNLEAILKKFKPLINNLSKSKKLSTFKKKRSTSKKRTKFTVGYSRKPRNYMFGKKKKY